MQNFIVYHATNVDEINECAYSLLKYLDVYNLKPPSDHHLVIYTNKPAMLESYGSLFSGFELRDASDVGNDTTAQREIIKNLGRQHTGNILYMGAATYPVKDLSMLFSNMEKGTVYGSHYSGKENRNTTGSRQENISVLGFNTKTRLSIDDLRQSADLKSVKGFIEEYIDLKEFRLLLKEFFIRNQEESIPNLVKLIHHVNAKQIQDQKKQFQQLPVFTRMFKKMLGRGWNISQYASKI